MSCCISSSRSSRGSSNWSSGVSGHSSTSVQHVSGNYRCYNDRWTWSRGDWTEDVSHRTKGCFRCSFRVCDGETSNVDTCDSWTSRFCKDVSSSSSSRGSDSGGERSSRSDSDEKVSSTFRRTCRRCSGNKTTSSEGTGYCSSGNSSNVFSGRGGSGRSRRCSNREFGVGEKSEISGALHVGEPPEKTTDLRYPFPADGPTPRHTPSPLSHPFYLFFI